MAHRREVINFVWLNLLDNSDQIGRVGQVAVMQFEFGIINMRVLIQVINPVGVKQRGTAFDAVYFIALAQQQFSQVSAILPGHAGD